MSIDFKRYGVSDGVDIYLQETFKEAVGKTVNLNGEDFKLEDEASTAYYFGIKTSEVYKQGQKADETFLALANAVRKEIGIKRTM